MDKGTHVAIEAEDRQHRAPEPHGHRKSPDMIENAVIAMGLEEHHEKDPHGRRIEADQHAPGATPPARRLREDPLREEPRGGRPLKRGHHHRQGEDALQHRAAPKKNKGV